MGSSDPPGPRGLPVVGTTPWHARSPTWYRERCVRRYGDVVYLSGIRDAYLVASPNDIERVLETDAECYRPTGDVAEVLDPTATAQETAVFAADEFDDYAETMAHYARRAADRWELPTNLDGTTEIRTLAFHTLARTLFGSDLDYRAHKLRESVDAVCEKASVASAPLPRWVPSPSRLRFRRALENLRSVVDVIVRARRSEVRRGVTGRDDVLTELVAATQDADVSSRDVRDEVVAMLFAGYETTVLALSATWYLLATHPGVAERVRTELDEITGGGPLIAADLDALTVTDRVLSEALRLFPPVSSLARVPTSDVRLGNYEVSPGVVVIIPTHTVHRDGRWYDDPATFAPDRWGRWKTSKSEFTYLPFGRARGGLPERFATVEAKLLLATLSSRYDFSVPANASPTPERGAVPLRVTER
ncbi:MAG: cytochrome P450 [Halobacteriota archaeon]